MRSPPSLLCFPISGPTYWLGWEMCSEPSIRPHTLGAQLICEPQRSKESQLSERRETERGIHLREWCIKMHQEWS